MNNTHAPATKKPRNERFVRFQKKQERNPEGEKKDFATVVYIGETITFLVEVETLEAIPEAKQPETKVLSLVSVSNPNFKKLVPPAIEANILANLQNPRSARLDRATVFFVYDVERELKASSNTGTVFANAFQKLARKDKEGKLLSMLEANENKQNQQKKNLKLQNGIQKATNAIKNGKRGNK